MSIFDPQGLYFNHQKSTKFGQVLQKKATSRMGAITRDEIPRSVIVLDTYGYTITPPGGTPPVPPGTILTARQSLISNLFTDPTTRTYTPTFNEMWNIVKNDFSDILAIPLSKVSNAQLSINVTSLNLYQENMSTDTLVFASSSLNDSSNYRFNCDILYQTYNNQQATKVVSDGDGIRYSKVQTNSYVIAGHTTSDWEEIVTNGRLINDVDIFTISQSGINLGEINYTIYVEAIVNYII